jgi:hypothetical protein
MQSSRKSKLKIESTSIRFGSRVALDLAVQLRVAVRTVVAGTIRNASMSGAYIQTALALPLHTNLVVALSTRAKSTSTEHSLPACVVRIEPGGVGVEWRDIACTDIMDLLERASNHPAVD